MNQVTQMFKDSNARMRNIMTGKFNAEEVSAAQREGELQVKILNSLVAAFGVASKNNRAIKSMQSMNIIGETSAVDLMLGDPELDKVKCPYQDNLITRSECLDWSGDHMDECSGCETGQATKRMLTP